MDRLGVIGKHAAIQATNGKHLIENAVSNQCLRKQELTVPEANAILGRAARFRDFHRKPVRRPLSSGNDGLAAVELAQEVIRNGKQHVPIRPYRKAG